MYKSGLYDTDSVAYFSKHFLPEWLSYWTLSEVYVQWLEVVYKMTTFLIRRALKTRNC